MAGLPTSARLLGSANSEYEHDRASYSEVGVLSLDSPRSETHDETLGEKDLTNWLSFVFLVNQIYGPGVLALPIVFQQAGIIPVFFTLVLFMVISCFAATSLCESMALVPGNIGFQDRLEYTTIIRHYFGGLWYILGQIVINVALQAYNISSIIICAQSIDQLFTWWFGHSFALVLHAGHLDSGFITADDTALYQSGVWAITVGYIVIGAGCIPMSMMNLDDNVKGVQVASFVALLALVLEFSASFIYDGITNGFGDVPWFGDEYTQLVGVFIFSWAFVVFVPSWVNEKSREVNVNKLIWYSGAASCIGYFVVGLLCAVSHPGARLDNMLVRLAEAPTYTITRISAYLFSLLVIAPGIPICSITTRYNLYVGKVVGRRMSYFWGVFAPWTIGWVFSQGAAFANLLNWSSLLVSSTVNFIVPLLLLWAAYSHKAAYKLAAQSEVDPFPFTSKKKLSLYLLVIVTVAVLVLQIGVDVYYAAKGVNLLSN